MATSASPQTGIYKQQIGPGRSATMVVDEAGVLDITSGTIRLPSVHRTGYIPLNLFGGRSRATATASGSVALTTATQPKLVAVSATDGHYQQQLLYTSAAGSSNYLVLNPLLIPPDLSSAGGMTVRINGERSSANASAQLMVYALAGNATANIGTTVALTSSPSEVTVAITSGNTPASGYLNVMLYADGINSTGFVALYAGAVTYTKKTS